MNRKNMLLIAIVFVGLIGLGAILYSTFLTGPDLSQGEKSILILAVDESEPRPGMGAVDMAFMVKLNNGNIVNYTPIYPGDMRHPTQAASPEAQAEGSGSMMLLHDSLWDTDTTQGIKYAEEIVEHNTEMHSDAVVAINTKALDTIIKSAGDLKAKGKSVNISAIDLIREEEHRGGMKRGDAVLALASALSTASNDPSKRNAMVQAAMDQYSQGNIVMVPSGSFMSLLASKGLGSISG